MRNLLIILFILLILTSCKSKKGIFHKSFNTENLVTEEFSINIHRDTSLQTKEGIHIIISANSISSDADKITLQVKEALEIADMVKAGLFTVSGKDILSSDGMFYIGTREKSTINKPFIVQVPKSAPENPKMKLYKGEETGDGINWTDPEDITQTKVNSSVTLGEKLFASNCSSCHYSSKDEPLVAPSLMGLDKLRGRDWLYDFTYDNAALRRKGDVKACCVYNQYNHLVMPRYNLGEFEIVAVYNYLANETRKNYGADFKSKNGCDSCEYYNQLVTQRQNLINDNGSRMKFTNNIGAITKTTTSLPIALPTPPTNKVIPINRPAEYYQVDIKTYGWYNIDVLMKNKNNTKSSVLMVYVKIPVEIDISAMLVIPGSKIYAKGGILDDNKAYGFDEKNGNVLLPQGVDAYIIAYSEDKGKVYFNIKKFVTSLNQKIEMDMPETNKDDVLKVIQTFDIKDVDINISRTKNADKIEAIDSLLKELKGASKNCYCNEMKDSSYEK